jgi:diguanylate cyclase (GGDEF)-like protein
MSKKPVIGLLIDRLSGYYRQSFLKSLSECASREGMNLLTFVGENVGVYDKEDSSSPSIKGLISHNRINILLFFHSVSSNDNGIDQLGVFLKESGVPVLSLYIRIPSIPCVLNDNRKGINDIMDHLIVNHNCKRIAFTGIKKQHFEGSERFEAYKNALDRHKIKFDPDLVYLELLDRETGENAAKQFAGLKNKPDAVVASNDLVAFGLMNGFSMLGLRVPEDILVTGYDNAPEASYGAVPLSTVSYPHETFTPIIIEIIKKILSGESIEQETVLQGRLILRHSCGCLTHPAERGEFTVRGENEIHGDIEDIIKKAEHEIMIFLSEYAGSEHPLSHTIKADLLLSAFLDGIGSPGVDKLQQYIESVAGGSSYTDICYFEEIVKIARRNVITMFNSNAMKDRAEKITDEILTWLYKKNEQIEHEAWVRHDIIGKERTRFKHLLDVSIHEPRLFFSTLRRVLDDAKIQYACLVMYEKNNPSLIFIHSRENLPPIPEEGISVDVLTIVPDTYWPQREVWNLAIHPLSFGGEISGYLVFDIRTLINDSEIGPSAFYRLLRTGFGTIAKIMKTIKDSTKRHGELYQSLLYDPVTELMGISAINETVQSLISASSMFHYSLSVMIIDVDKFNYINSSLGYNNANSVLKSIADSIIGKVRLSDRILRPGNITHITGQLHFGGDEFIIMMPHCGLTEAVIVAERVKKTIFEMHNEGHTQIPLTISVGVATAIPGDQYDDLLAETEKALLQSKMRGGNSISIAQRVIH